MTPRDETERDLLRQIVAAPGDDRPRLVLADLLQGRGDPRGEYIAVACELAKGERGGRVDEALKARAAEMLRANGEAWESPFAGKRLSVGWLRGFPVSISVTCEDFVALDAAALADVPLQQLALRGDIRVFAAAIAAKPVLARFPILMMNETSLDDEALAALASSPHFAPAELQAGLNLVGGRGVAALASAPAAAQLTRLELWQTEIGPGGAVALATSELLGALRELNLYRCGVRDAGAKALASARVLGNVRTLDVSSNRISAEGGMALAGSSAFPLLSRLFIDGNDLGDAGAETFARAAERGALEELRIWGNRIGIAGARALASSTLLPNLRDLDLRFNPLGVDGITALADGTGLPGLRRLGVSSTRVFSGRLDHGADENEVPWKREREENLEEIRARFKKRKWEIY